MSRVTEKRWWIVKENKEHVLKLLSWKEVKKITPSHKFHWPEDSPDGGHSYLEYLKEKGRLL